VLPRLVRRSIVPGRVRWHAPAVHHQPRRAAVVEDALRAIDGVTTAHVNPLTGTLLVHYDANLTNVSELEGIAHRALTVPPLDMEAWRSRLAKPEHEEPSVHGGHNQHHDGDACGHGHDGEVDERVRDLYLGGAALSGVLLTRLTLGTGALVGQPWVAVIIAVCTVVTGLPFLRGGWRTLRQSRRLTTDILVSSATIASIFLGETVTALTVIWLLNLGEYLQSAVLRRTRHAIRALLELEETDVWLVVGDAEVSTLVNRLIPGDLIVVYAGKRIPVDGRVEDGSGTLYEAPITGESMPVVRTVGDQVYAGTVLLVGRIRIRVERVGADTAVGRLIQRVEQAQESRAPIQTIGDRFSARFVPASFALSALVLLATGDLRRALTMLLVACPCASGLATPTAVSAGIGNGARRGILIKGGRPLEVAAHVDAIVFDKTGTLTTGNPTVARVITTADNKYTPTQVLSIAANAELHSEHPLGLAVVAHARDHEIVIAPHDECRILVGRGMHADWHGDRILVGSASLLEEFGVPVPMHIERRFAHHSADAETMMYVVHNDEVIGLIGVRDHVRPDAPRALADLRVLGVKRVRMLTGDGEEAAASVARLVGVDEWRSRMLPDQKYDEIHSLKTSGHTVAMVGDGINDAPALALADVGIAMGTAGSDVAIEAADIALASSDLRRLGTTIRLSQQTIRIIQQNYAIALGVNAGGVMFGAFGLLNPLLAAVLHNLSTLLVVVNSARLVTFDPDRESVPLACSGVSASSGALMTAECGASGVTS
jgi:manganese-transporting P-type ATPase C